MQPQDFNSMQEKALQYAREMQKKSQYESSEKSCSSMQNHGNSSEKDAKQQSVYNNNYNFSNGFGGIKNIFYSGAAHTQSSNSDIYLILSLILLLSSDGGDRLLMLALLYIMT